MSWNGSKFTKNKNEGGSGSSDCDHNNLKPGDQVTDHEGNIWNYEGKPKLHGENNTYRGTDKNRGSQCTYRDDGTLLDEGEHQGTYDKYPPYDDDGNLTLNVIPHFFADVVPHFLDNNYTDGLTYRY